MVEDQDPGVRAHRLAEEVVRRMKTGKSLGSPSTYNIVREVLIEEFAREFAHQTADPPTAPAWLGHEEATAWQNGWSAAMRSIPVDTATAGGVG